MRRPVHPAALTGLGAASKSPITFLEGAVAQLGERGVRNAEVRGSIPLRSTKSLRKHATLLIAGPCAKPVAMGFSAALQQARGL